MSTWQTLVDHLTSPDAMENDPHTVAIGLEMESLAAIYGEDACRLHTSDQPSRPSSMTSFKDKQQAENATPGSSRASSPRRAVFGNGSGSITGLENSIAGLQVNDELVNLAAGLRLRYELVLPLFAPDDPVWKETQERLGAMDSVAVDQDEPATPPPLRILVSLGPRYPVTTPPQLQLLGRYVGQFSMDADLFGSVTKTYISSNGVPFTPGDVAVFEGVNHVLQVAGEWYKAKVEEKIQGENKRQAEKEQLAAEEIPADNHGGPTTTLKRPSSSLLSPPTNVLVPPSPANFPSFSQLPLTSPSLPAHIQIHSSPPITVSKSVFIGHACRVTHPLDVPLVIHHLLSDKKIAKAAHPVIHAYRIVKDQEEGGKTGQQLIVAGALREVLMRSVRKLIVVPLFMVDNDDDGETAAGGRLAHLLQILVSSRVVQL